MRRENATEIVLTFFPNIVDTRRYRIGPNFAQLPVNRPTVTGEEVNSYFRDGPMCFGANGNGSPNYFPNSYGGLGGSDLKQTVFPVSGDVDRVDTGGDDNFSQCVLWEGFGFGSETKVGW
jgi:catalase